MHRIGNQRERVRNKPENKLQHHKRHIDARADGKTAVEVFRHMMMMPVAMVMPVTVTMRMVMMMMAVRAVVVIAGMCCHGASIPPPAAGKQSVSARKSDKILILQVFPLQYNRPAVTR